MYSSLLKLVSFASTLALAVALPIDSLHESRRSLNILDATPLFARSTTSLSSLCDPLQWTPISSPRLDKLSLDKTLTFEENLNLAIDALFDDLSPYLKAHPPQLFNVIGTIPGAHPDPGEGVNNSTDLKRLGAYFKIDMEALKILGIWTDLDGKWYGGYSMASGRVAPRLKTFELTDMRITADDAITLFKQQGFPKVKTLEIYKDSGVGPERYYIARFVDDGQGTRSWGILGDVSKKASVWNAYAPGKAAGCEAGGGAAAKPLDVL